MSDTGFKLKSFENIFAVTDPENQSKNETVYSLQLDKLLPFKNHPFKLYKGERFDDMVESIKANGVLVPIIVRSIDKFTYEILSGHNRVEGAKVAGLETVPSIIKEELADEDALLIVTETNLLQRSFSDLSHSERAVTLSMHHDAIKKQGKRTDLISEIENMVNASNINDCETCSPVGNKLKTIEKIGQDYGMAKNSVARYLRINTLILAHKERLDNNEIPIRAAVELSYLTETEQQIIDDILISGNYRVDMKKAESLRQLSEQKKLTAETVEEIFAGKTIKKKSSRPAPIKLKAKTVAQYFKPEQKQEEIEDTIIKALDYYFSRQKNQDYDEGDDPADGDNDNALYEQTAETGTPESVS